MSHEHELLYGEVLADQERGDEGELHSHVRRDQHGGFHVTVHDHADIEVTYHPREEEDFWILQRHLRDTIPAGDPGAP